MSEIKHKKVIVIGGAGFVGSELIKSLVLGENKIFSLDNYSSGSKKNHIENDSVKYYEGQAKDIDYFLMIKSTTSSFISESIQE